ncbi:MAG: hypothetical protein HC800_19595 [Phormidesmis sp. RL_2_1]|nr:hypothetical protein [Phormidesmis sp. RL_2_1]
MEKRELSKHIKYVMRKIFGQTHPINLSWNMEKSKTLRSLVDIPMLGDHFVDSVKQLFQNHFPTAEIGDTFIYDEWRNGNARAVSAYIEGKDESEDVTYYLITCALYPIATLRANFRGPSYYFDALDERWRLKPDNPVLTSQVNENIAKLNVDFSNLVQRYGFMFEPYDSEIFQERLREGYFWTVKVWDYLFYIGDS